MKKSVYMSGLLVIGTSSICGGGTTHTNRDGFAGNLSESQDDGPFLQLHFLHFLYISFLETQCKTSTYTQITRAKAHLPYWWWWLCVVAACDLKK